MKLNVYSFAVAALMLSGTSAFAEQTLAGSMAVSAPKAGANWSDQITAHYNVTQCVQHESVTGSFNSKTANKYATYKVGTDAGDPFAACNTEDSEYTLHFKSASSSGNDVAYVKFVSGSSGSNTWKVDSASKAYGGYTLSTPAGKACGADDCIDILIGHE